MIVAWIIFSFYPNAEYEQHLGPEKSFLNDTNDLQRHAIH